MTRRLSRRARVLDRTAELLGDALAPALAPSGFDSRRLHPETKSRKATRDPARDLPAPTEAEQQLARAEAVYHGFVRRREDARARLVKMRDELEQLEARAPVLRSEIEEMETALAEASGEDSEALEEIATAKELIRIERARGERS